MKLIKDMETISQMNTEDIKIELEKMRRTTNQKVRRWQKFNENESVLPGSYTKFIEGGRISVKDKNRNELIREYKRGLNFVNAKSANITQYKQTIKSENEWAGMLKTRKDLTRQDMNMLYGIAYSLMNDDLINGRMTKSISSKIYHMYGDDAKYKVLDQLVIIINQKNISFKNITDVQRDNLRQLIFKEGRKRINKLYSNEMQKEKRQIAKMTKNKMKAGITSSAMTYVKTKNKKIFGGN